MKNKSEPPKLREKKIPIASSLKSKIYIRFKTLCIRRGFSMSSEIEKLIEEHMDKYYEDIKDGKTENHYID